MKKEEGSKSHANILTVQENKDVQKNKQKATKGKISTHLSHDYRKLNKEDMSNICMQITI